MVICCSYFERGIRPYYLYQCHASDKAAVNVFVTEIRTHYPTPIYNTKLLKELRLKLQKTLFWQSYFHLFTNVASYSIAYFVCMSEGLQKIIALIKKNRHLHTKYQFEHWNIPPSPSHISLINWKKGEGSF